jgi:hypothetical protein
VAPKRNGRARAKKQGPLATEKRPLASIPLGHETNGAESAVLPKAFVATREGFVLGGPNLPMVAKEVQVNQPKTSKVKSDALDIDSEKGASYSR